MTDNPQPANEVYVGPTELTWTGDGTSRIPGVPARDLSDYDIDRLVYRQTTGTREGTSDGLRKGDDGFDAKRASVVAGLVAGGLYAAAARPAAPKPPVVAPTPAPVVPAAPGPSVAPSEPQP